MGKPVIDVDAVIVEPPKNFSPGKYSLENAWPSKWISPEEAGDALSPGLAETLQGLNALLLPAVQQAKGGPLLVKFVDSPEELPDLEGVSQLKPPGAGENGPPLMLKIEGVEGDSPGAWGGLSDLIEDPGPILEGPPKGVGPGESHKLGEHFNKLDDGFIKFENAEGLLPANVLGALRDLDPDGLLLPAINGQDSLLFVKVELTEQDDLSKLEDSFDGDLQILQAGQSGIIGFTDDLNIKWTPTDAFELKLEDGGGEADLILG